MRKESTRLILLALILFWPSPAGAELVRITHYDVGPKSCGKWADGVTATGIKANPDIGICAVSAVEKDRLFPLHSIIYVPGSGILIVADIGGGVRPNQLDVLVADYETAVNLGVRWVQLDKILVIYQPKGRYQ